MPLESATYVNQLVVTNPADSDQRSTSSAHHRVIKTALLNSFPNIGAAVNASAADLNVLTGLGATPTLVTPIPSGTVAMFLQASAPTGWTQVTTWNDALIRVVNGAGGATTGGAWTISGVTVSAHALVAAELPPHTHNIAIAQKDTVGAGASLAGGSVNTIGTYNGVTDNGPGTSTGHTHGLVADGTWRPAYVNAIVCSKN